MADRQEFQQERSRLLRDPEAGGNTPIEGGAFGDALEQETAAAQEHYDALQARDDAAGEGFGVSQELPAGTDAIEEVPEEVRAATEAIRALSAGRPEVEVTATIVDEGIAVTFLIPHSLIGVALSE